MRVASIIALGGLVLIATATRGQSFGTAKEKVFLQRKLPALAHLNGTTIRVKVTAHPQFADLAPDLESMLETELLKNDPHLSTSASSPSTLISCQILDYAHPRPIVTTQQNLSFSKKPGKTTTNTRITGSLSVSFQARSASGQNLSSDTITSRYDETFNGGNDITQGIKNSVTGGWKRITGNGSNEDLSPPTDAELRSRLINDVVHQIAAHLVNTNEIVEVFLAKGKGPIDQGDKEARAGLWERALETYETAPQNPKSDEDAYRLYNIGVAYEALAYKAEDKKSAMKYLDQAAINYGKAIDSKPAEKYFLEPQKRIETAIVHYKRLQDEESEKSRTVVAEKLKKESPAATNPAKSADYSAASSKAITNQKIIAMIKAGLDDDTVAQTIRNAKLARFDLSAAGLKDLSSNGVSDQVVKAMKLRDAHKTVAAK